VLAVAVDSIAMMRANRPRAGAAESRVGPPTPATCSPRIVSASTWPQVHGDGAVDAQPAGARSSRVEHLVGAAHGRAGLPSTNAEDCGSIGAIVGRRAAIGSCSRCQVARDQRDEAGAEHLGVDPEAAAFEQRDGGVGHRADADLERGAVEPARAGGAR
jgi:hypothetical protein